MKTKLKTLVQDLIEGMPPGGRTEVEIGNCRALLRHGRLTVQYEQVGPGASRIDLTTMALHARHPFD